MIFFHKFLAQTCSKSSLQPTIQNAWKPVFLPKSSDTTTFYQSIYRDASFSKDFQLQDNYQIGDVAVFECYEDFMPVRNDDFLEASVNYNLDVVAARRDLFGKVHPIDFGKYSSELKIRRKFFFNFCL